MSASDAIHPEPEPEEDLDVTRYQSSPVDADPGCPPLMPSPQSPKTYSKRASSCAKASLDPYVTRSGKTARPLEKLDFYITKEGRYAVSIACESRDLTGNHSLCL
ncbi:hypothetical protein AVEN_166656-1 [Araneus ventricosus]|uniref:Uncharacterized protein n=1 Tax=Araneus ventricosus TaxID=182803 RepID=A0A4Y2DZS7_ARAVE|nr:hypothetical protein AVEN_166656-1 [Araneus ventricosus]